jgi:hypothetical protein
MRLALSLLFLFVMAGIVSTVAKVPQRLAQSGVSPSSCLLQGRIIKVYQPPKAANKSLCSKYSCKAQVEVMNMEECGAGAANPPSVGDTIECYFAYTLAPTRKLFPRMKVHYPGLRKGERFSASVMQKQEMGGSTVRYAIFEYKRL